MIINKDNKLWQFKSIKFFSLVFFIYLYLPILILIVLSFNAGDSATIWTGFSLKWYLEVLSNDNIINAAKNSLIIASISSSVATVSAIFAAIALQKKIKGSKFYLSIINMPLFVPEIVTAVASLLFFVLIGIRLGLVSVIIAHTVFCIPFAFLPIRARLAGLDSSLSDAAGDLYANYWQTFKQITLPLLWPGILSGWLLAFIISLDDFVMTYFVGGAGSTTLPVYIFGMIRIGITPEVNAVSTLMLLISIIFVSLSFYIGSKQK